MQQNLDPDEWRQQQKNKLIEQLIEGAKKVYPEETHIAELCDFVAEIATELTAKTALNIAEASGDEVTSFRIIKEVGKESRRLYMEHRRTR